VATVNVQNGKSCILWFDNWNDQLLKTALPELYSFAKNQNLTVAKWFSQQQALALFNLPLSAEAFQQFQILEDLKNGLHIVDQNDIWKTIWGTFLVSKMYKKLNQRDQVPHTTIFLALE
jgi:hypothetical protein